MKLLKWLGTAVEDKSGAVSHKRLGFYWCMLILHGSISEPTINNVVIYSVAVLAFGLVGLTIPEWFSKIKNP